MKINDSRNVSESKGKSVFRISQPIRSKVVLNIGNLALCRKSYLNICGLKEEKL